jgi:hypothetical protein
MSLSELDEIITSGRFPALKGLGVGWDPCRWPGYTERAGTRRVLTASILHTSAADEAVAERLLGEFRRAAEQVPAYQALLAESGVRPIDVRDVWAFSTLCPVLSKVNTFDRFPAHPVVRRRRPLRCRRGAHELRATAAASRSV